jgi:hypothetical protein
MKGPLITEPEGLAVHMVDAGNPNGALSSAPYILDDRSAPDRTLSENPLVDEAADPQEDQENGNASQPLGKGLVKVPIAWMEVNSQRGLQYGE